MEESETIARRLIRRLSGLVEDIDLAIKQSNSSATPHLAVMFNEYLKAAPDVSPTAKAEGIRPFDGTAGDVGAVGAAEALGKLHGLRAQARRLGQALEEDFPPTFCG